MTVPRKQDILRYASIVCVSAAVLAGFFVIGSPTRERARRFDERRLSDLQNIQWQIASYYGAKETLPTNLKEIVGFQGYEVPTDPETAAEYEYVVRTPLEFTLCAVFAQATEHDADGRSVAKMAYPAPGGDQVWRHDAGRFCYDLSLEIPVSDGVVPPVTVRPGGN